MSYFSKINQSDIFVFLDDAKFSKQSFTQRNRIKSGWLTVPIRNKNKRQKINEVLMNDNDWRTTHLNKIVSDYKTTEYFNEVYRIIDGVYDNKFIFLDLFNKYAVCKLCALLGITTELKSSSDMSIGGTASERIVAICQHVKADTYLSGTGAKAYNDKQLFSDYGIVLKYQRSRKVQMSIIDTLFKHGVDGTKELLK